MNQDTLELNKTTCDKCEGDGKNFAHGSHEFFKRWRVSLGLTQIQIAAPLRCSKEEISKFENGHLGFSETRQRKLAQILANWK